MSQGENTAAPARQKARSGIGPLSPRERVRVRGASEVLTRRDLGAPSPHPSPGGRGGNTRRATETMIGSGMNSAGIAVILLPQANPANIPARIIQGIGRSSRTARNDKPIDKVPKRSRPPSL